MLNGKKQIFENNVKSAFESGYSNAAASLSKLTNEKIHITNFHCEFVRLDSEFFSDESLSSSRGSLLITTEIFGDTTGKSYLFFSDKEFDQLTAGIPHGKDTTINLKEEFLKEVDNILSASVITRLSNELNLKMYGDIPTLIGKVKGKIEDIIYDDFNEQTEEVYINSVSFSFEKLPEISPVFIWVLDSNILKSFLTKSVA